MKICVYQDSAKMFKTQLLSSPRIQSSPFLSTPAASSISKSQTYTFTNAALCVLVWSLLAHDQSADLFGGGDWRERLITAFPPISVPQAGHELNRSDVTFIIRPLGTDLQIAHNNYCCQVDGL